METIVCTPGAVDASTMCVAAARARLVVPAAGAHLLLPTVRTHSQAGVGLFEVQGSDRGWGRTWLAGSDVVDDIDSTYFPTRLGPPPDSPPV